jgi:hypothetical protein
MNTIEIENETELISEIDDLSSYLRDVPLDLRESGAFTPYEVRLQQLLESLLTLRLKQGLQRFEQTLRNAAMTTEQRATFEEIQQWVRRAERRHEDEAQDYLRVMSLLNGLVVARESGTHRHGDNSTA